MRRRRRSLVLVLLLAAACDGKEAAPQRATGWTRSDLKPVTQPAPVGNRFVLFTASDDRLSVEGLDVRTGKTVWSDYVTTSGITPGQIPFLTIAGTRVIYPKDLGRGAAEIVAADAADGTIAWRSGERLLTGWPSICPDDPQNVCATGTLRLANQPASNLRFDVATGDLDSAIAISKTIAGRELGPGLFDPGERDPEMLVATRGDVEAWRRPLRSIFSLAGASTDYGWLFDRVDHVALFVGTPGWPPARATESQIVLDQTRTMTAGFRISDGTLVWRSNGTRYICGYVLCPGVDQMSYSVSSTRSNEPSVGVRLKATGTLSGSASTITPPKASPGARAILEGFDLATGKTTWSFDGGNDLRLLSLFPPPARAGPGSILVTDPRGNATILSLADGATSTPNGTAAFWCPELVDYKLQTPDGSVEDYVGQFALYPCGSDLKRVPAPKQAPRFAGAVAGGVVAWSESAAVVAVPVQT